MAPSEVPLGASGSGRPTSRALDAPSAARVGVAYPGETTPYSMIALLLLNEYREYEVATASRALGSQ
jgi:hypothetical protein